MELVEPAPSDEHAHIVCECPNTSCSYWVEIPIAVYDRVRAHPRWFIVAPGHEGDAPVLERLPTFTIIEVRAEAFGGSGIEP